MTEVVFLIHAAVVVLLGLATCWLLFNIYSHTLLVQHPTGRLRAQATNNDNVDGADESPPAIMECAVLQAIIVHPDESMAAVLEKRRTMPTT